MFAYLVAGELSYIIIVWVFFCFDFNVFEIRLRYYTNAVKYSTPNIIMRPMMIVVTRTPDRTGESAAVRVNRQNVPKKI